MDERRPEGPEGADREAWIVQQALAQVEARRRARELEAARRRRRRLQRLLLGAVGAWIAAFVLAPWDLQTKFFAAMSGVCAQQPSHSYFFGGRQLPLCARDSGIYAGFLATLLWIGLRGRRAGRRFPPRSLAVPVALGAVAMVVDGFNSLFVDLGWPHLYPPHNLLRLATGLAMGNALALFLIPLLNELVRPEPEDAPILAGGINGLGLIGIDLILLGLLSSGLPGLFWPLTLFSVAGEVLALTLVNLGFLGTLNRRLPLGILAPLAVLAAFSELAFLGALRALLTGR